jgi:pyruvate dehydrogenase complex dehydrogenase (E1) component
MPRDNRTIVSAVRHKGEVYGPGREDELEELLDKEGIDRLVDNGAITGDWGTAASRRAATSDEKERANLAKTIEKGVKAGEKLERHDSPSLEEMNRDELTAFAEKHSVKVEDSMIDDEIRTAIKEKMSITT